MIFFRYLTVSIIKGTALVLIILVSLNLFFTLIQQIDQLGKGHFSAWPFIQYILLKAPAMVVYFMPLATLLGSILSLGNLASNSELIAFQSSGVELKKFVITIAQAALVLAILSFCIADLVVPYSETTAREIKTSSIASRVSMQSRRGVWIKDKNNIIFIQLLFPDGNAKNIEIYHLDEHDKLLSTTFARKAITKKQGWMLMQVNQSIFHGETISRVYNKQLFYGGNLSEKLLESLVVNPQQMSSSDLYNYVNFLQENKLNHAAESLSFWRKVYSPLTVIVMAVLAIPFVLGSQRSNNTGQRIITGILLGLVYTILDNVLIQLGEQMKLAAFLNAIIPTFIFIVVTSFLLYRKVKMTR